MTKIAICCSVLALASIALPLAACASADDAANQERTTTNASMLVAYDSGILPVSPDAGGVVIPVVLVDAGSPTDDCNNAHPRDLQGCMACCATTADRLYPLQAPENTLYRTLCGQGCAVGTLGGTTTSTATWPAF